jgi:hypothetical protein
MTPYVANQTVPIMFVTSLTLHQIAGSRRIRKPFQIVGEDRSTAAADDYIYEDDSVKRSILSSPLVEFGSVYSATNNFSEKLGEGGFGPVFKVELVLDKSYTSSNCYDMVKCPISSVHLLDNHSGYLILSPGDTT